MYKNKLRFLHDKYSQFEVDFLFELEKNGNEGVQLPNCMYLLVKRIADAGYCHRNISKGITMNGMVVSPTL